MNETGTPSKFTTFVKVRAFVTSEPDLSGRATKTEYLCYVCCGDHQDDLDLLKHWLFMCCQTDLEKMRFPTSVLDARNYARAILAIRYFQKCFEDNHDVKHISETELPKEPPTQQTDKYKIWVSEVSRKEMKT